MTGATPNRYLTFESLSVSVGHSLLPNVGELICVPEGTFPIGDLR